MCMQAKATSYEKIEEESEEKKNTSTITSGIRITINESNVYGDVNLDLIVLLWLHFLIETLVLTLVSLY